MILLTLRSLSIGRGGADEVSGGGGLEVVHATAAAAEKEGEFVGTARLEQPLGQREVEVDVAHSTQGADLWVWGEKWFEGHFGPNGKHSR